MKYNQKRILLGVLVILVIVFVFYFLTNKNDSLDTNTKDDSEKKDFEILSIQWNDYLTEHNPSTDELEFTDQKVDWDKLCSTKEGSSYYSVQTDQKGIFICEYAINGITQYYENYLGYMQEDLLSYDGDGISNARGIFQPMSPFIENEFTFCCERHVKVSDGTLYGDAGYTTEPTGEIICDSMILPAKCL